MLESLAIWRRTRDSKAAGGWWCMCGSRYTSRDRLSVHIRSVSGDGCFEGFWDEFVLWMIEMYGTLDSDDDDDMIVFGD